MVKRNSLAKMGVVLVAVLIALGVMGTPYSYWSQMLNIMTGMEIGTVSTELSCDGCSPAGISCNVTTNELELEFTVTNAQFSTDYYCDFIIENTGTIPVKIESIDVSPLPPAPAVEVDIQDVAADDQIDPAITTDGTVYVYLSDNTSQGEDFDFTVTFEVVQWNQ